MLVSLAMQFKANTSKLFAVFDYLVVLIDCSDVEMLRSGDFCATDNRKQMTTTDKQIALPLVHAYEVKIHLTFFYL